MLKIKWYIYAIYICAVVGQSIYLSRFSDEDAIWNHKLPRLRFINFKPCLPEIWDRECCKIYFSSHLAAKGGGGGGEGGRGVLQ